jgi:hypothetical protein
MTPHHILAAALAITVLAATTTIANADELSVRRADRRHYSSANCTHLIAFRFTLRG